MSELITQTARVNAERKARPIARPNIYALRYSMQPVDLPERRQAAVRTVVGQGVETLTPVIHFAGLTKPLVLDTANVTMMSVVAGSPLFGDWVGCSIELQVLPDRGVPRIMLGRVQASADHRLLGRPPLQRSDWVNVRGALLLLGILLLALSAVYLVEHFADVVKLLTP